MTVQRPVIDAMLILRRDDGRVLLAERANTGYADGQLNVPSGKVEDGENAIEAVIREAWEEIGIKLNHDGVTTVHVVHHRNPEGEPRIGWFCVATRWDGEPVNREPHKCAGLQWADPNQLPRHTVPYVAVGITAYLNGTPHSVHGWD
jgi:8-oxo-dGTP diphosphatase